MSERLAKEMNENIDVIIEEELIQEHLQKDETSENAYNTLRIIESLNQPEVNKIQSDPINKKFIDKLKKDLNDSDRKKLINEFSCECESCFKNKVTGDKNVKGLE